MPLQNIIKIFQTTEKSSAQEFGLEIYSAEWQEREQRKSYPSYMWHSYLTWYMSHHIIIKLAQTLLEL